MEQHDQSPRGLGTTWGGVGVGGASQGFQCETTAWRGDGCSLWKGEGRSYLPCRELRFYPIGGEAFEVSLIDWGRGAGWKEARRTVTS